MNIHDATETAYKNGYEAGYKDGKRDAVLKEEMRKKEKQYLKKLFISYPMNGLDDETIKKLRDRLHTIAEAAFGEKLEVIDSYFEDDPDSSVRSVPTWYIGKSIQKMAEADYFIGVRCSEWRGCSIERDIALIYNIPSFVVYTERIPEFIETEKQLYTSSIRAEKTHIVI